MTSLKDIFNLTTAADDTFKSMPAEKEELDFYLPLAKQLSGFVDDLITQHQSCNDAIIKDKISELK